MVAAEYNLWSMTLRREQFVELLDGRGPRPTRDDRINTTRHFYTNDVLGIWLGEQPPSLSPLPQIIVAQPDELQNLFAWSSSYLRELGPLSAICRPFTTDQFNTAVNREVPSEGWRIAGGVAGLIIGEILALSAGAGIEAAYSARPNTTLSFALLRGWALGFPARTISEIARGYRRLPRTIRGGISRDLGDAIEEVSANLLGIELEGSRRRSYRALNWLDELRSGVSQYELARDVFGDSADLLSKRDVDSLKDATAEQRVKFFDFVAPTLIRSISDDDRIDVAFMLAFAAFICRPGLEQQSNLLHEYALPLPEAWLWLGVLQSFASIPDVLSLGFGAGWRIAREVFRTDSMWESTNADASLLEIDVLSKGKSKVLERLLNRPRLEVEVYPMVTTVIRGMGDLRGSSADDPTLSRSETEAISSKQLSLIEVRLEETLLMIRSLRGDDPGRYKSTRRRR